MTKLRHMTDTNGHGRHWFNDFIQENVFQKAVCKMAAIVFSYQYVE